MGVNKAALKAPSGLLKIVSLVLTLVVLILARVGFSDSTTGEVLYQNIDHRWLTIITTGGFTIILSAMILTYILGHGIPDKMELIFMFTGCVLFLATGAMTIDHHQSLNGGSRKDTGLAMGSMAVITGIVMFLDCLLIGKALKQK